MAKETLQETTKEQWKDLTELKNRFNLQVARTYHVIGKNVNVTILFGGLGHDNPKSFMDYVVAEFVGSRMFNEYIDSNLDNPWLRIIIEDINNLIND